jgi:hypothetical protein
MKIIQALASMAFFIVTTEHSLPYTVDFGGTSYYGNVAISGFASHWDEVDFANNPQSGPYRSNLTGNDYPYGMSQPFSIVPEAGDVLSGMVDILLSCSFSESYNLDLTNFAAPPLAARYDTSLSILQSDVIPQISVASFSIFSNSTFIVALNIGQTYQLNGRIDPTSIDEQMGTWSPSVVDPSQEGTARLSTGVFLSDYSIQVVPEPNSLVLLMVGLPLIGFAISRGKLNN